jgi:Ca2+-transporting ATPase
LTRPILLEILFLGLLMGGLGFVNFALFMGRTGADLTVTHELYARATTLSYATIVFCQFVNILSRRYTFHSLFNVNLWSNKKMLWSVAISIGFVTGAIYAPFISGFLGFAPLTVADWASVLAGAGVFLAAHESIKAVKRAGRTPTPAAAAAA